MRRDLDTDGRHATVAFTDDWREDAARRDFTINALYADPASGEVFDYFGGIADLEARRVRFIGDPLTRIAEDHLRILRFFRFLARFGDAPDAEGLKACTERANDLMALSRERIANELLRLLVAPRAPEVVALMIEHGIFAPVLARDRSTRSGLATLAKREAAAGIAPDPIRRLAALLPSDPVAAATVGARLKLSNAPAPPARKRDGAGRRRSARAGLSAGHGARDRPPAARRRQPRSNSTDWTPPRLPLSGGATRRARA